MEKRVFGNRYQVLEKIGMGGMAEVYKATDSTLGRTVALKVMLPQYATDPSFAARFRQEAQAAANLQSPYIVNIYDWGQDQGSYYIVMEYVRGTDLKTALEQRGRIHPRKVAEIASQVCSALSVAHGYDIIHRDIKSANIMVQADGNVKVMDFGIAQAGNTAMTQTNSVLGTAHYVSPEQAQGKTLTAASDLYSLGIVMYEAACGELPFDGPDAVSVAMKQVSEMPIPPRQLNPDIDPALEAIIMRAMAKSPEGRYSTANEMREAIDAYLSGNASAAVATTVIGAAAAHTSVMQPTEVATPYNENAYDNGGSKKKMSGGKKALIAIIIIIALAAAGFGVAAAMGVFTEKVTVPNVVSKTQQEATETLQTASLKVGNITYEVSDTVQKGNVISTNPAANSSVAIQSSVDLTISSGKDPATMISVPNLIGLSKSEAEEKLAAVGLVGSSSEGYSDDYAEGQVFEQTPADGNQVPVDTTVNYKISQGKKQENVTVPSVIGLDADDAESTLEGLGLTVKTKEGYSDNVSEGQVCDQSISSGTSVSGGSTITITISKGKQSTSVPSVVGATKDEATATLEDAGFKVSKQYVTGTKDQVIDQDPSSGSSAKQGSTVVIYIGTGA